MSHREEASGKTQDTLEKLCLSAGLGTPRGPPGRAGGSVWGEGSLGISAQTAASATRSQTKRMKKKKKICVVVYVLVTLEKEQLQIINDKLKNISDMAANHSQLLSSYSKQLQDEVKKLKTEVCPDEWKRFGRSCYFKSNEKKD
ncbi:hypothetical protein L3Q82_003220 [Scortum barcoo]|uniref:Uncharacterized protein n=1 Tax=Scortum barcoo TaxID=214431 RepID=A0ACB8VRH5_9TELE|nr:hypothetical protein L3Q82_003220 [Scortum barcoo]